MERGRQTSKWILCFLAMSVKTGMLRGCGSSSEGNQIHAWVESVFLENLMPKLSLGDQVGGKGNFITAGHWRLRNVLEPCGWDMRHEKWGDMLVRDGTGEIGRIWLWKASHAGQVVGPYSSNDGLPLNCFPERSAMVILESHSEKSEKNQERVPGVGRQDRKWPQRSRWVIRNRATEGFDLGRGLWTLKFPPSQIKKIHIMPSF